MNTLVIDNEEPVRSFLADFITSMGNFTVNVTADPEEALGLFDTHAPKVILLDVRLPKQSGFELLQNFKERGGAFEVIIITGNAQMEDTLTAFKYGAYDFILKPFKDLTMLERSIRRAADTARLKVENEDFLRQLTQKNHDLELMNQTLEKLSITDELTGLFNMRYMKEFVSKEIERCARYGRTFAFIVLDLDNIKAVNDIYGHMAGRQIIKEVGNAIHAMMRHTDTAARFGGDEFLIFADEAGIEVATTIAERVRTRIETLRIKFEETVLCTTASFGIACYPDHSRDYKTLFAAADKAMYMAKSTGKNRVEVASA